MMVFAVDDDQVLEAPGDEQFAIRHQSQVAGTQIAAFTRPVCPSSLERVSRLRVALPVSLCHARAGDPDLADNTLSTVVAALRANDGHVQPRCDPAAGNARQRDFAGRCGIAGSAGQGPGKLSHDRRREAVASSDQQRGLGQAVAKQERLAAEAAGGKGRCEPLQGFRLNRLGAIEGYAPGAEIKPCELLGADGAAQRS